MTIRKCALPSFFVAHRVQSIRKPARKLLQGAGRNKEWYLTAPGFDLREMVVTASSPAQNHALFLPIHLSSSIKNETMSKRLRRRCKVHEIHGQGFSDGLRKPGGFKPGPSCDS
jgi:hypothetical protein